MCSADTLQGLGSAAFVAADADDEDPAWWLSHDTAFCCHFVDAGFGISFAVVASSVAIAVAVAPYLTSIKLLLDTA